SRAGFLISQVAEEVPEHIAGLIFVAAFMATNGNSLISTIKASESLTGQAPQLKYSKGRRLSRLTDRESGKHCYNTTSIELQQQAVSLLGSEPMLSFSTPINISSTRFGTIPRTYIECLQDIAIPIAFQRSMQQSLPCQFVATIDCDHSPFYSASDLLAKHIIESSNVILVNQ